jgi:hypothetical protein
MIQPAPYASVCNNEVSEFSEMSYIPHCSWDRSTNQSWEIPSVEEVASKPLLDNSAQVYGSEDTMSSEEGTE